MLSFGVFGITNDGLNQAVSVLHPRPHRDLGRAGLLDLRRRPAPDRRPDAVGCATAASLFPFVGTIVYAIVRPPEYLDDVRLRELEMTAAEARLANLDYQLCPHCDYEVKGDYLRCPSCMRKLKDSCFSLREADRPGVEAVPVLRGGDGRQPRRPPRAAGAVRRRPTDQPTVGAPKRRRAGN